MLGETPRKFDWSQLIAAGATFNPLDGWQYETPEEEVMVEVIERATATGLVGSVTTGGDNIKQEGPIQAGGTAGTLPSRLNTEPATGRGHALRKLRISYRNPTAGGITVDGIINYVPLRAAGGGGRRPPRRAAPPIFRPRRRK